MKLWHSFKKELKLASKGMYFYIEVGVAVVMLLVLLLFVPKELDGRHDEYLYLDLPQGAKELYLEKIRSEDLDGQEESVTLKQGGRMISARKFVLEDVRLYVLEDREAVIRYAEEEREVAVVVALDPDDGLAYTYYLQGYESEKLRNLYLIFYNKVVSMEEIEAFFDDVEVRTLEGNPQMLNDRENLLPPFLTFNGSLMGLFILAAYVFLDKQEGVVKAYAVTAASVWQYLMSKVGVILFASVLTSIILVAPVMGTGPNYPLLLVFLAASGFFASALGLVLTSFYRDIEQAFGALYILIMVLILPNIAYFTPSWEPAWLKAIPSHAMLESFKEIILDRGDMGYVLGASAGFLAAGAVLFLFANHRFKKTLTL
ncbi:ABC transporter permease [Anaerotalea alkaliphila]|uniref:ABC transporter permease n=1 Tax=Anaerotalea alkaliphila TaxID=2662126 RepID=A0A7X5HVK0_9FIRM|nr:ABC transporter permease [Anaerotalea alkaliphila]NDL67460.1 ABC transporter permease [Anaerotalea alkaliphila]